MKKILITLFVIVGSFFVVANNIKAAEGEFIELYPYDNILSMDENSNFTGGSKVGTSNWSFTYAGHRYHSVRGAVRYAKDFEDKDNNGLISAAEMNATLSWNAFASIIINDTEESFVLSTANGRTDLTTVVHRVWTYYNEAGELELFEDQINQYWIVNDGDNTPAGQNWRLATDAEAEGYKALEELPANVLKAHIRLLIDAENPKGYVLEPIEYIKWSHLFKKTDETHPASIILDAEANVDFPEIKAGYTVVSYGTVDRDGTNKKTLTFIESLPKFMTQATKPVMKLSFVEPKPTFGTTLTNLDKDLATKGINYIIEYESTFTTADLIKDIAVTYQDMFAEDGTIINETVKTGYEIRVKQNDELLETVKVNYNAETKLYEAETEITKVNTSEFGQSLVLEFFAASPNDPANITIVEVDLAVGVIPPKFVDVPKTTVYAPENMPVDLLGDITANNSYGVDLTNTIKIDAGSSFNQYNPKPGVYDIKLFFEYVHVIKEAQKPELTVDVNGTPTKFEYQSFDVAQANANSVDIHLYSKQGYEDVVKEWASMNWTSELLVVEDGKIVMAYSRHSNKLMNEENPLATNNAENTNVVGDQWYKTLELTESQTAIVIRGTSGIAMNGIAKAAVYGQTLTYVKEQKLETHTFEIETSYKLQIDDLTNPVLIAKNNTLTVKAGQYTNADDLIKGNVIATDNFSNVSLIITNKGGLDLAKAGTYEVSVKGVDESDNESDVIKFTIVVEEDTELATQDNLQQALDLIKDLENKLNSKSTTNLILTIVLSTVLSGAALGAAILILKKK